MSHDDDANEDALAGVDLHAWRVPPAPAANRPSILLRALSPAAAPRRARLGYVLAAVVLLNAVVAAIVVIIISRPVPERVVTVAPAGGGGSVDAKVEELLRRLQQEQQALEDKLAEIQDQRALIAELSAKAKRCEDERNSKTLEKPRDRTKIEPPVPQPVDGSCDEVSCVLNNYRGTCCLKFRRPRDAQATPNPTTTASNLPENLDRYMISAGVASVKADIARCGDLGVTGKVKVTVRVDPRGRVAAVSLATSPDPQLGECVLEAMKRARFEPTQQGGSFSYPFVF